MIAQHASNSVRVRFLPIIRSRSHEGSVPKIDDLDPNRLSISDNSLMIERKLDRRGHVSVRSQDPPRLQRAVSNPARGTNRYRRCSVLISSDGRATGDPNR